MSYWEHREGGGGTGKIEVSSTVNRLGEEGGDSKHRRCLLSGPGWRQWDGGGNEGEGGAAGEGRPRQVQEGLHSVLESWALSGRF